MTEHSVSVSPVCSLTSLYTSALKKIRNIKTTTNISLLYYSKKKQILKNNVIKFENMRAVTVGKWG